MHFDDDMIVMEKWIPKKPISAIYFNGEKEMYYVKRFLIEQEGREESFISDHANSQLEIVSTDWKPMAEVVFAKDRGKERKENLEVNLEEFIDIKGVSAQGNQLSKEKINQINLLEPLPHETPEDVYGDDLEIKAEKEISSEGSEKKSDEPLNPSSNSDDDLDISAEGQITLF